MKSPHRTPRTVLPLALVALLCVGVPAAAAKKHPRKPAARSLAAAANEVSNGGFESSLTGWKGYRSSLGLSADAGQGARSALVAATGKGTYSIYPSPRPVRSTVAGERYAATALVKGAAGVTVCLQVREWASSAVGSSESCVSATGGWQPFPTVSYAVEGAGHSLEVYAYGKAAAAGESFRLDAVTLGGDALPLAPPSALSASAAATASVSLSWQASPDARVTGYDVSVDGGTPVATAGTTYTATGLACGTSHLFTVSAHDAAGASSSAATLTASTAACAVTASGTFYISPSGSDANAGTLSAPWKTIQHAVDTIGPGETAVVRAGTYPDWVTWSKSGAAGKPAALAAYPGERPTFTGRLKLTGSYTRVSGLRFVGRTSANADQVLIYVSGADHVEISGNELTQAAMSAIFLGDQGNGADDVRIVGNWIHDNGTHDNHDHGIYYGEGTGGVIAGNLISGNFARGIQCYPDCDSAVIANNTVVRNGRAGIQLGSDVGLTSDDDLIVNNVVAYNGDTGIRAYWGTGTGTGNLARNNLSFGNAKSDLSGDGIALLGNLTVDPLFVGASDYHLQPGSPARGVAIGSYVPSVDLDGVSGGSSLGAYQR